VPGGPRISHEYLAHLSTCYTRTCQYQAEYLTDAHDIGSSLESQGTPLIWSEPSPLIFEKAQASPRFGRGRGRGEGTLREDAGAAGSASSAASASSNSSAASKAMSKISLSASASPSLSFRPRYLSPRPAASQSPVLLPRVTGPRTPHL
jgi:hypothetical protein